MYDTTGKEEYLRIQRQRTCLPTTYRSKGCRDNHMHSQLHVSPIVHMLQSTRAVHTHTSSSRRRARLRDKVEALSQRAHKGRWLYECELVHTYSRKLSTLCTGAGAMAPATKENGPHFRQLGPFPIVWPHHPRFGLVSCQSCKKERKKGSVYIVVLRRTASIHPPALSRPPREG